MVEQIDELYVDNIYSRGVSPPLICFSPTAEIRNEH